MVDPKKIDEILNILYNNVDNNHITTVEYVCKKVFNNDKLECNSTVVYMVNLGYINYIKGSTKKIQLEQSGRATIEAGGYEEKIKESERQERIKEEKEEIKEVERIKEQKKSRKAIYWSVIISAVFSNLDRLIPWLKSLLGL